MPTIDANPDEAMPSDMLKASGSLDDSAGVVDLCFSRDNETLYYAYKKSQAGQRPRVKVHAWNARSGYKIAHCTIDDTVSQARILA